MRVLVLGGSGMLGHKVFQVFAGTEDVWCTVRGKSSWVEELNPGPRGHVIPGISCDADDDLIRVLSEVRPDVVVNCVGIVKQLREAKDAELSIRINSLLPHRLATLCSNSGVRLIHISTDCVFSGTRGGYFEDDLPDPPDLYGRSKLLGESLGSHFLTLRTSIIGRELQTSHGLVEWFLAQQEVVQGFACAYFSGLTTLELARTIAQVTQAHQDLVGLYHVSADPIDKYSLLGLIARSYSRSTVIERNENFVIDRTLNSDRFRHATGWLPPTWPDMIDSMASDPTPYATWRETNLVH